MGLVLPQLKPAPRWESLDLGDGVLIGVEITPPTYAQVAADRCMVDEVMATRISTATPQVMANLNRLECLTNWRCVLRQTADGGTVDVPFSREALAEVFVARPRSFLLLLKLLAPLFAEPAKNQPAAATSDSLPPELSTSISPSSVSSPAD